MKKPAVIIALVLLVVAATAGVVALQRGKRDDSQTIGPTPAPVAAPPATTEAPDSRQIPVIPPPRSSRPLQVFDYGWFTVGYDNERRAGAWV